MIPLVDLKRQYALIEDEINHLSSGEYRTSRVSLGLQCQLFNRSLYFRGSTDWIGQAKSPLYRLQEAASVSRWGAVESLTGRRINREGGKAEGFDGRCRLDPRSRAARSAKQPCGYLSATP